MSDAVWWCKEHEEYEDFRGCARENEATARVFEVEALNLLTQIRDTLLDISEGPQ